MTVSDQSYCIWLRHRMVWRICDTGMRKCWGVCRKKENLGLQNFKPFSLLINHKTKTWGTLVSSLNESCANIETLFFGKPKSLTASHRKLQMAIFPSTNAPHDDDTEISVDYLFCCFSKFNNEPSRLPYNCLFCVTRLTKLSDWNFYLQKLENMSHVHNIFHLYWKKSRVP